MKAILLSLQIAASFTAAGAFAPIARTTQPYSPSEITKLSATAVASVELAEGLTKAITQQGTGKPLRLGDVATVSYNCYVSSTKQTFARSTRQKMVVGDGVMIEGWEKALSTMVVGEKAIISITGEEGVLNYGYGTDGVGIGEDMLVPSMAELELEIEILDAEDQRGLGVSGGAVGAIGQVSAMTGSGDLGALDPSKPRTPEAIAAAYKARQEQIAVEKEAEKEGLEGLIEKAKDFYFFGFFEGETGEQAPWILRPSITFPIAFAVVGAGFYVTYALGGISERGVQVKDELDDIILSYNMVKNAIVVAFAQMNL